VSPLIDQPLLDSEEIAKLINSGASLAAESRGQINQHLSSGSNKTSLLGSGTEFDDLRVFQLGDDPRHIDWRASARSREPLVRTYHSEFQQPLQLVVDRNSSMRFGTKKRLKVTQAARLSLWLSGIFHQQNYALGALLLEQDFKAFDCRVGADWLNLLSEALVSPAPPTQNSPINWISVLTQLLVETPAGAKVVLISDFSSLNSSHRPLLTELAERYSISAFAVSDPIERDPKSLLGTDLVWGRLRINMDGNDSISRLQQVHLNQRSEVQEIMSQSGISLFEICSSLDHFSLSFLGGDYHE
jgi:uncharacterized protein (DUF58 family)